MAMRWKNIVIVCMTAVFLFGASIWEILSPDETLSVSERRRLAAFPDISVETVLSGRFMEDFEDHALDQFPLRDRFRTLKAATALYILGKKDNNEVYMVDGHLSKLDYPLDMDSVEHAVQRFHFVYERLLKETSGACYFCMIPDKNYFMAKKNGYPTLDHDLLFSEMQSRMDFCRQIDIRGYLKLSDYYRTDPHWKQEDLCDVASYIAAQMGEDLPEGYTVHEVDDPFYGSYYGQSALPFPADRLRYLDNEMIREYTVHDHETGSDIPVYDLEKLNGNDKYEMYLAGPKALLTIENPLAESDKELIVFRDSFGSSLAPLLAQSYQKTTLVDIRYISPEVLGQFLTVNDQDILFLYSTSVLNNSETMK